MMTGMAANWYNSVTQYELSFTLSLAAQSALQHMGVHVLVSGFQQEEASHLVRKALRIPTCVGPAHRVANEQIRSWHGGLVQKAS